MTKFVVLYCFHRINSLSLNRLKRLRSMNPDITFVPFFGVRQVLYIPMVIDLFRKVRYVGWIWSGTNRVALASCGILDASRILNERLGWLMHRSELNSLGTMLDRDGMKLYCDFTPLGGANQDLAILTWFAAVGKNMPFEYLIFYEYDMYTTKTISSLYEDYTAYDAAFAEYQKAGPLWFWWAYPPGARRAIAKWLRTRGRKPVFYHALFAGSMVSREALEVLSKLRLPYGFCEMRLPTLLGGLGFKCANLNFPMMSYRPIRTKSDVLRSARHGIFHPVYDLIDEDERVTDTELGHAQETGLN